MNLKSITYRLTVWYFLAFLTSSILVFGTFYYLTQKTLLNQTDYQITLHATAIEQVINLDQPFPKDKLANQFSEMPGMLVIITDKNGDIIAGSQPINQKIPIPSPARNFINETIGTSQMRIGIFPLDKTNYLLVAHPTDVIRNSLNKLIIELGSGLLFIGILSILGGYIIAKNAMAPLTLLSDELKSITANSLNKTISNPNTADELEDLTLSFNSLLKRLSRSFERERQFIGDVGHELKTPLATLKNSIEVALTKKRPDLQYKQTLSNTLIDIDQLVKTVSDVLDLAWSESDNPLKQSEIVNLSLLILELADITKKMANQKKITIITEIEPKVFVNGKHQKLFRAFFDILDNSIKYTPKNAKVAITLERMNNNAVLEISNTGPGISKKDLPHIFDRFYRGSKKIPGTGLGLSIAKSIIIAHGGNLSIRSTPHKITTVIITLPLKLS